MSEEDYDVSFNWFMCGCGNLVDGDFECPYCGSPPIRNPDQLGGTTKDDE